MTTLSQLSPLCIPSAARIALVVMDGLGGLPHPETGETELESARTPNLDYLAKNAVCGLAAPIGPGLTPGSGPGHLALFGYDPMAFTIGRGILEALGIDFPLEPGDVAARGNFCTIDDEDLIVDRRAGRISTDQSARLCQQLGDINIPGVECLVSPVEEHRFLLVLRGENLNPDLGDSDPQQLGLPAKDVSPLSPEAIRTAALANEWVARAKSILTRSRPANMVLLRGFSRMPDFPDLGELYKLHPVAVATYPMYRGLAKLVGMKVVDSPHTIAGQFATLAEYYEEHDFFFLHIKQTDSAGEDGDFTRKVRVIEEVDAAIPALIDLRPEVIVVTGDHSTPAVLKAHSWHPVPFLLHSQFCRPDEVSGFSERACARGSLGTFPALDLMPLALANARRLTKFGA
jgi:2,3-bisphosphoglycerate-independent phosphoglycerate mutase